MKSSKVDRLGKIVFDSTRRRILHLIMNDEGIDTKDITERLDTTQPNASRLLNDLVKEDLIEKAGKGRKSGYQISDSDEANFVKSLLKVVANVVDESDDSGDTTDRSYEDEIPTPRAKDEPAKSEPVRKGGRKTEAAHA